MRIIRFCVAVWFFVFGMGLALTSVQSSFGESGLKKYESNGLVFRYSSDLMLMSSSSAEKIRNMLNAQMKGMGNSQSSVIALDVLLNLPAFRVLISKEHFVADPTPPYLIQEKKYFFAEAKKRGAINSYGIIQEKRIAGYPTIVFKDIDKGAQGYGSNFTILCGMDTWNLSFTGSNKENYENYQDHMSQILSSIEVSGTCKKSNKVLS
ncbi:MAG: hypothetical protein JSU60_07215 [Nitrospirota bacterium]|nr:MAG: hypothetical protein JSU60_07215 [Nitrospirota bacterium]